MLRATLAVAVLALAATDGAAQVRVLQTNSRGGSVHVIDPATQTVVGEIQGVPVNHGVAASPDGTRIYVSSEAENAVMVIDAHSLRVVKTIPLSARPNNIALTPDGSRLYVGIIARPGAIDVIDTRTLQNVKTIPHPGGIHNLYVTPDGRYVVAGSIAGARLTVYETATDREVWAWEGNPIRPVAISAKPDGSTDKLYVQISGHHGFVVLDFDTHREVARVTLPDVPEEQRYLGEEGAALGRYNGAPAHGIGVSPDGRTVWSTSRMNSHVYVYSAYPELELLASIPVGTDPDWITFTPDNRFAYVANAVSNDVTAIDMRTYQRVATIPVGEAPKRNGILTLPHH
ncbi:MAG TPA: beta-propeller fold lactonase family protein [Longimicrobiales bacterium]|nr:beta-propeller fold lactonase family protein [Longimicrobiales bacterium]